ncbi:SDR family NAD(P)-dependent oxidoreductase [Saccharothrix longispora]|uniref:Acyl transferase domain-containing protein/NADPH:quinone reductase-like Zn-dependent oxidoreductase/acyl carrier protein n=1 Tax=Saccharothrix longispora TaxID=33920 RepID=A0ABU1PV17_9PSEU|nr:SDR family NAD(P)-dependent oxidoreductase [Saccharothrix longispora]MDR6594497.1 acyl transferase domain-containing protein/NADPH:quinone reductase-like Zn-dependent oxidoreductase/acyl carrier protein [Saccharothrix longispora]
MTQHDPVAVIGVACRLPGGITNLDGLWAALSAGRDLVGEIPSDRFDVDRFIDERGPRRGKSYVRAAGVLTGVDLAAFDADYFGMSPKEAARVDPQQRLLLEMAVEALDDAGIDARAVAGSDAAVVVGITDSGYSTLQQTDVRSINAYTNAGGANSIAANRLSHFFDLRGPSLAVDTACSSSLVALHQAVRGLAAGEGELALVGGISLLLNPATHVGFAQASMLSPSGRCRTFSADADGYVRAEGGAVVVLKRLSDAVRDGDRVHAVIPGSGVNCDGRTAGLASPRAETQETLLREVYRRAGVEPGELVYFEAHGTGTPAGDPAECAAVGGALGRNRTSPLPIGSVKTNLGHLEAASGLAGLLKAVLVLRHGEIPASLHGERLNPAIDFAGLGLAPVARRTPLKHSGRPVVGVNSFGFGGANAHVVLTCGPAGPNPVVDRVRALPVVVSGHSREALARAAALLAEQADRTAPRDFYDLCHTATRRRGRRSHRAAVLAENPREAADRLRALAEQPETVRESAGGAVFVFTGNGAHWARMGVDLLDDLAFRTAVEQVDTALREHQRWSVLDELRARPRRSRLRRTEFAQPALFAVQVGVVAALRARGIVPAAVVGHSVGEIAAAHVAGALDLGSACRVLAVRSAAQGRTAGRGRMAAIGLPAAEATRLLVSRPGLSLAGINSDQDVTISGDVGQLADLGRELAARGVFFRELDLDYAFHSPVMDAVEHEIRAGLAGLAADRAVVPMVSSVTGRPITGPELDARYWWRNVREPVAFAPAVRHLLDEGVDAFVEIGPHPVLRTYLRRLAPEALVLPTLRRDSPGGPAIRAATEALVAAGAPVDWDVYFPRRGNVVELPAHPWQRERHWNGDTDRWVRSSGTGTTDHPLLGERMPVADPTWQDVVEPVRVPWLADHRVGGAVVMPASGYVEMALAAGARVHGDAVEVTGLRIDQALVLPWDEDVTTSLQCSLAEDGTLRVAGRTGDADSWRVHATGRVRRLWQASPPVLDLDADRPGVLDVPVERHYRSAAEAGLDYGPSFRVLRELRVGPDEVVARYHHEGPLTGYEAHPAVLDGALQAGAPLLGDAAPDSAFLPAAIGAVRRYRAPSRTGFVHVRSRHRDHAHVRWDVVVADDFGVVAVELDDVVLRRFDAAGADRLDRLRTVLRAAPLGNGAHAPLPGAREVVDAAADDVAWARHELERLDDGFLPRLVTCSAHYAASALQQFTPVGRLFTTDDLVTAGMLPKHTRLVELLLSAVEENGLAHREDGGRWRLTGHTDPDAMFASAVAEHPQHLPELVISSHVGGRLADVLGGHVDPTELIFTEAARFLEQYYDVAPVYGLFNQLVRTMVRAVVADWPEDRPLRVLEVGGGTGGATAAVLPVLPPERAHYVFTDQSHGFFPRARTRFQEHDFVRYEVLDLDHDPASQGFVPGSFDVVIASNVLHATADLRRSLRSVADLLTDRGLLLAYEAHTPEYLALPFGVLDGFWRHTDTDLRTRSPLLSREQWPAVLDGCGFDEVAQVGAERGPVHGAGAVIVASRAARTNPPVVPPEPVRTGVRWVLVAEDETESDLVARLARRLTGSGDTHTMTAAADVDRWAPLLGDAGAEVDVVLVLAEHPTADVVHHATRRASVLRALATACDRRAGAGTVSLWLVTRPSGALPGPERPDHPADAATWGVARSLAGERPDLTIRRLSLHRGADDAGRLTRELLTPSDEDEVVLTAAGRFVPRVVEAKPLVDRVRTSYRLDLRQVGLSFGLAWITAPHPTPGPEDVVISVRASALNYRDVMLATGALPPQACAESFDGGALGLECAGVVTAVGPEVTSVRPGDRVAAFAARALSSDVVTPVEFVIPLPEDMPFTAAATLPVAAATVEYGLVTLARLAPGEVVLVHGGAGGVGLAALQCARRRGATVIATAGSPVKRAFLRSLGVEHVLDSRGLAFAAEVMAITGGRGVDVVLNSLAGEALTRSLELLRPHGRFVELGKRDIVEDREVPLRPLRRNASMFCVDLSSLSPDDAAVRSGLFTAVAEHIGTGAYRPLPHVVYPVARVAEAFELLRHSRHIGKVVVSHGGDVPVERPPAAVRLDGTATYLVTGGLGGFGAASARWLAAHGARHLALVGRRGADTLEGPELLAELARSGVTATAHAADVADGSAMRRVLAEVNSSGHPLRGVLHAAMVLDDAPLTESDDRRFDTALRPKAQGAVVLDALTASIDLDFFMLFSSAAATIGLHGQTNYVAGNLFLEALARARRGRGLPGQAIGWGAISEVGHVARSGLQDSVAEVLRPVRPAVALAALGQVLGDHTDVLVLAGIGRNPARRFLPGLGSPRMAGLFPAAVGAAARDPREFHRSLAAATPEQGHALLRQAMTELLASVLQTAPERVDETVPLDRLGVDSLMSAEFLVAVRQQLGCELSVMEAAKGGSIIELARIALHRTTSRVALR